jgi:hypothetical protein
MNRYCILCGNEQNPLERRVPATSRPRFYCEIEDINFRDFEQWGTDDPAEAARLIEETLAKFRKGEK